MSPVAAPTGPTTPAHPTSCPDCRAPMAADQRYCLACGHRRGEPRLPFMTAAGFMDSPSAFGGPGRTPPPPASKRGDQRGWNPNAVLVIGVATLLLAIGIGFLIGRTLHEGGSPGHNVTERITIENGGQAPVTPPQGGSGGHGPEGSLQPGGQSGSESPGDKTPTKKPSTSEEDSKAEEEEAKQKTKEALHYQGPLAKPKATLGESCEQGTPGCGKDHKFHGVFFGTEE